MQYNNRMNPAKTSLMAQKLLVLFCLSILFQSCSDEKYKYLEISYEPDMEEFTNPERGFYRPMGTSTSDFKPLDVHRLLELRRPNPAAGGFTVASTLIYRSYRFDTFKNQPLDDLVLTRIQNDMDIIREAIKRKEGHYW